MSSYPPYDSRPDPIDFDLSGLRVAIVHQWFVRPWGGAEHVAEALATIFPQADLFTVIADPSVLPADLAKRKITTTFLQHIPGRFRFRRHLIALYPLALEQLDLSSYDLVISSESAPAKGVITSPSTCHICYCHSPMRYIWEMYHGYTRSMGRVARLFFGISAHYLRLWDLASSARVDYFIANSAYIAQRIRKHYRRTADVIHPPVRVERAFVSEQVGDYYLVLGRLVDYKRVDLAVEACKRLNRRLIVAGDGPQMQSLRRIAGQKTEFLGHVTDEQAEQLFAHCRALLFPGEEDFGIVPVEAQSYGRPVICFARGGVLETVKGVSPDTSSGLEEPTGVFFFDQSVESVANAILQFEQSELCFRPAQIRRHASNFDQAHFHEKMLNLVKRKMLDFHQARPVQQEEPVLNGTQ